jgi:hypothetical protein
MTKAPISGNVHWGPSYTILDSHRSDIKFYCFEVNLALKIMII